MKLAKKILIFIFLLGLFFAPLVKADTSSDVQQLQQQIDEYTQKLAQLGEQSTTLENQIAQFDAQIYLTGLKITQTEDEIALLGGRIDQLEAALTALSAAFSQRAIETYKMARVGDPLVLLLSAPNLSEAVSRFHYLELIQGEDRNLLQQLQSAQTTYQGEKADQETLQAQLNQQEQDLDNQKAAKAQLLVQTQNDEQKYQQLLTQARAQLAAIRSFVTGLGGASILQNQTYCDSWGCYYNQRDAQWGNNPLGSSTLSVAEYGCLVSSSAMIATHYGKTLNPGDIAANSAAFFSPDSSTAYLWDDITVNGIRIVRTSVSVSTASIDSELSAGRPVIVGLYAGPAHFVVLKSGSNGNYVMDDPFVPNGHDISFTSKYNVSDITDVEQVSVP